MDDFIDERVARLRAQPALDARCGAEPGYLARLRRLLLVSDYAYECAATTEAAAICGPAANLSPAPDFAQHLDTAEWKRLTDLFLLA